MIEFPIVETEGTPYEMGLQHGRKARMPEALEEMRAISEGAQLPYEDILLLNLSIELWREEIFVPPTGCTLIGMADKEPLVAKTMDMVPGG